MTPVGHSLTGATLALLALPYAPAKLRPAWTIGIFVFLANIPDLKIPHWGHDRYDISHSLITTLVLSFSIAALLLLFYRIHNVPFHTRFYLFCGITWLSHIFLDTLYNHGLGLGIYWPIHDAHLALPIPWLETLKAPLPTITLHSLRVFALEILTFAPLLLLTWIIQRPRRRIPC